MKYLTKEEVVKIIKKRFEDRHYIKQPTTWVCMLTGGTTEQRQNLGLFPINATPTKGLLVMEFFAEHPDIQPRYEWITQVVDNLWNDFGDLSHLQRGDFEADL